jgi:Na+-transporting NADH:ubiquinone oxidoreductase subunit B
MYNTGYQANLALEWLVSEGELAEATAGGWRGEVMAALGLGYGPGNILSCFVHGALYFLPIFIVTQIAGGLCEVLFASIRKHEINEGFLVTGMLYPLILPPTIPLWQVALGIIFGVVIGKEIFGGTGKNILNPALTARAFVFFAFPAYMTGDTIWVAVDGVTAATPLGQLAVAESPEGVSAMVSITDPEAGLGDTWNEAFFGFIPGSMGETSALACILGAVILVASGIGSWTIMLSMAIGAIGLYLVKGFSGQV